MLSVAHSRYGKDQRNLLSNKNKVHFDKTYLCTWLDIPEHPISFISNSQTLKVQSNNLASSHLSDITPMIDLNAFTSALINTLYILQYDVEGVMQLIWTQLSLNF